MSGPDLAFFVAFAPTNAADLARAVQQFSFSHFAHYWMTEQFCRRHGQRCSYDLYIDTRNYQHMVENIEERSTVNLWVYHAIEVCQASLSIERGYDGYGDPYAAEERALVRWLLGLPQLELQTWQVVAGGDGYDYSELASGSSGTDLLVYLDSAYA